MREKTSDASLKHSGCRGGQHWTVKGPWNRGSDLSARFVAAKKEVMGGRREVIFRK